MSSLAWQYMHASVAMWISSCGAAAICRIWPSPRLARAYCKPFVTPWSVCLFDGKEAKESQIVSSGYRVPREPQSDNGWDQMWRATTTTTTRVE